MFPTRALWQQIMEGWKSGAVIATRNDGLKANGVKSGNQADFEVFEFEPAQMTRLYKKGPPMRAALANSAIDPFAGLTQPGARISWGC
jgi:hypothetical protein